MEQNVAKIAVAAAVVSIDKPYDYEIPAEMLGRAVRGMRVMVPFGRGNSMTEGFILSVVKQPKASRVKKIAHIFDTTVMLDEKAISLATFIHTRYFCTFFEAANLLIPTGVWSQKNAHYVAADIELNAAIEKCETANLADICTFIFDAKKPVREVELKAQFPQKTLKKSLKQLEELKLIISGYTFDSTVKDHTIKMISLKKPLDDAIASLRRGAGYDLRCELLSYIACYDEIPEKEACYITGATTATIRALARSGILECTLAKSYRRPQIAEIEKAQEITLTSEQQDALAGIEAKSAPSVSLLNGVTGSGKTPIYIKLIDHVLKQNKSAILLVPEIALTPQMLRQFCAHFKDEVAVFHSSLSTAQRYDEYKRVSCGEAHVVIGTRSAIFAPIDNIGIIIIDEEQEWTYKSDISPRYHAREIAKFRCVQHSAKLVLGSATPAIESFYSAECGKYDLFKVSNRYRNTPLPDVVIADMRRHLQKGEPTIIGEELRTEIERNIEKGEQTILFINRRGNSRMLTCVECGYIPKCSNCSVALTYHSKNNRLMCHYCGFSQPVPTVCPECGGDKLKLIGFGTQKVQEELERIFENIKIVRMDSDTTTQRTSHEKLLDDFITTKADVLLGTQMIAKGLDFDNVTLVGVLDADLSLYNDDYRAGERTFSLLAQVIGRAGRRSKTGRAVIQTYTPRNDIILAAASQDYKAFYDYEIEMRRALLVPPFADIISFLISGEREDLAKNAAERVAKTIEAAFETQFRDIKADILGPAAPSIALLNSKYRFQVSFRGKENARTRELILAVLKAFYGGSNTRGITLSADINPYSL